MTTEEAINELQNIVTGLENDRAGKQKLMDAYNTAILQLKGLLDTPSADLQLANDTISARDTTIAEKDLIILSKNAEIELLKAEKATLEAQLPKNEIIP